MNLLACSAYWNSLPRSTPHSCSSETWSVSLPSRSKGDARGGKEAQNRRSPRVPGRQETDEKTSSGRVSWPVMAVLPTVSCGHTANEKTGAWSVQIGGMQSEETATFHSKTSKRDPSTAPFQAIRRDVIKALSIKVTRLTPQTICFFIKTEWRQPFDWCGNYFWKC